MICNIVVSVLLVLLNNHAIAFIVLKNFKEYAKKDEEI
jgi:hypothetical protein